MFIDNDYYSCGRYTFELFRSAKEKTHYVNNPKHVLLVMMGLVWLADWSCQSAGTASNITKYPNYRFRPFFSFQNNKNAQREISTWL